MAKATRYTPEVIKEYFAKGYWNDITISDQWNRNAIRFSDKEAVVDSRMRVTWAQAKTLIDRLALGLLEMGLKKDDMVVIQLPNCVELALLRVACERAGLLFLPALRTFRNTEMERILPFVEAKAIVIPWKFRDFDYFQMVQQLKPRLPGLKHVLVAGDNVPSVAISVKEMLANPLEKKYPPDYLEKKKTPATELSMVASTTGSTGFPKFVEHAIAGRLCTARGHIAGSKLTEKDTTAALGPAAAGPNAVAYLAGCVVGAKMVMLEHFDAESALAIIEKEKVTFPCLVPAMLAMMIRSPNLGKYDLSSMRAILCSGAILAYELAVEAEEKLKAPIIQLFGSMDGGGVGITSVDAPREQRLLTVGRPYAGNEVKFLDDEGREVKRGEVGEIVVRGPTLDCAFYKDPKATAEAWTPDGWFHMGDLGKWDEHGNVMVVGRKKDIIIRGGQNVYPTEVENLLLQHPRIYSVAIVPMPDPVMGERACAFVVPKQGQALTLEDISAFLKQTSIAPFKIPERLELLTQMPLVGDQKVDKKTLTQNVLAKLKAEGKAK